MVTTVMATKALYLDSDASEHDATVLEVGTTEMKGKMYHWVRLDETIFHPQGGGQLSDKGSINGRVVAYVHKVLFGEDKSCFSIWHCFNENPEFAIGQKVHLAIDGANRELNSRWHTAAHVVGIIIEQIFPHLKPFGGQCFPGDAYMKFRSETEEFIDPARLSAEFEPRYAALVASHPEMHIVTGEGGLRQLVIGGTAAVGCGGTHVHTIEEIGKIAVTPSKANKKEGTISVKYTVEP